MCYRVEFQLEDGSALDLTGSTLTTTLKLNYNNADEEAAIVYKQGPLEGDDAKLGIAHILFTKEQTSSLLIAKYYLDYQRTILDTVTTILRGRVKVVGAVKWEEVQVATSSN